MSIKRLFTVPEIIAQFESGEYSSELLLQHVMIHMKTNNEKRFEAAKAAMQGMVPAEGWNMDHPDAQKEVDAIAKSAVAIADALLAELARTELATNDSLPAPDADGWIVRIPTDPIPEKHNGVRFGDGEEELSPNFPWVTRRWRHVYSSYPADHITHYRP